MALKPIPKGEEIKDSITKHADRQFLSSTDLIGQDIVELTIERVEKLKSLEYADGKKKDNAILMYFKGVDKPLVLNSTNIRLIVVALNTNIVGLWLGKKIKLKMQLVKAFGETKPAVRVVG